MIAVERRESLFEPTLPGRYFYDEAIFAAEQERLFACMWVCVGRADAIPAAGDYFLADVGGESIVVLRGKDGTIRAFLNVCRHRGARLCTAASGQVGGAIQCRYHAWSYGLDGRLIGAPNLSKDERFERDAFGLLPVHLTVWEGLVWVNLSEEPEPLAAQLAPPIRNRFGDEDTLSRWRMGELRVGRSITYEVAANWKLIVENFMECYHCGPVHPELVRLLPEFRRGTSYQGLPGQGTDFAADIAGFTLSGNRQRSRLPGLLPQDDRRYFAFVLWPNVFVNLVPDHVILHTLQPIAVDRSRVVCDWLFAADEVARPDFDPSDAVDIFDVTNQQDWEVCELTQLGMRSRAYAHGGVYVTNEHHITVFRDLVLEYLGDSALTL
jgi:Rieske 2Fe-2S family protein